MKNKHSELQKRAIEALEGLASQLETCAPLLREILKKPKEGAAFRKGAKELRKWIKTL